MEVAVAMARGRNASIRYLRRRWRALESSIASERRLTAAGESNEQCSIWPDTELGVLGHTGAVWGMRSCRGQLEVWRTARMPRGCPGGIELFAGVAEVRSRPGGSLEGEAGSSCAELASKRAAVGTALTLQPTVTHSHFWLQG